MNWSFFKKKKNEQNNPEGQLEDKNRPLYAWEMRHPFDAGDNPAPPLPNGSQTAITSGVPIDFNGLPSSEQPKMEQTLNLDDILIFPKESNLSLPPLEEPTETDTLFQFNPPQTEDFQPLPSEMASPQMSDFSFTKETFESEQSIAPMPPEASLAPIADLPVTFITSEDPGELTEQKNTTSFLPETSFHEVNEPATLSNPDSLIQFLIPEPPSVVAQPANDLLHFIPEPEDTLGFGESASLSIDNNAWFDTSSQETFTQSIDDPAYPEISLTGDDPFLKPFREVEEAQSFFSEPNASCEFFPSEDKYVAITPYLETATGQTDDWLSEPSSNLEAYEEEATWQGCADFPIGQGMDLPVSDSSEPDAECDTFTLDTKPPAESPGVYSKPKTLLDSDLLEVEQPFATALSQCDFPAEPLTFTPDLQSQGGTEKPCESYADSLEAFKRSTLQAEVDSVRRSINRLVDEYFTQASRDS